MNTKPDILCIGSVLWDMIGRAPVAMRLGSDVPGRIARVPGGVAMNIAMTLARFGLTPALLSAVGRDTQGEELIKAAQSRGLITDYLYRSDDLPTDRYMAIEGANGLIAAIADAHSLEAAGAKILRPLHDGRLGNVANPYTALIALDGNLTTDLLREIADSQAFEAADLRVAPASPGKAERLLPLLKHPRATFYVNLEEAGLLCHQTFETSVDAASALIAKGAHRVLVTDGGRAATKADASSTTSLLPPPVLVTKITGAGDTFMAAHIASEASGASGEIALKAALDGAAAYISGDIPL